MDQDSGANVYAAIPEDDNVQTEREGMLVVFSFADIDRGGAWVRVMAQGLADNLADQQASRVQVLDSGSGKGLGDYASCATTNRWSIHNGTIIHVDFAAYGNPISSPDSFFSLVIDFESKHNRLVAGLSGDAHTVQTTVTDDAADAFFVTRAPKTTD